MKKYTVKVPVVGYYLAEVEVNDSKEAIKKAVNEYEWEADDLLELEAFEKIVQGNICYTYNHSAEIISEEEIE